MMSSTLMCLVLARAMRCSTRTFTPRAVVRRSAAGLAEPPPFKQITVAAAAIVRPDGLVLVAQRDDGSWEFPGGKQEAGERLEQTLARELREELGIELDASALVPLSFASSAIDGGKYLLMPLWGVPRYAGEPVGREGQRVQWVRANQLGALRMPPADVPLVADVVRWVREIHGESAAGI